MQREGRAELRRGRGARLLLPLRATLFWARDIVCPGELRPSLLSSRQATGKRRRRKRCSPTICSRVERSLLRPQLTATGIGHFVPSKAQRPVSGEAGQYRTNSGRVCHRRSRPRRDGRACPPLYINDETAEAASRTRGEPQRGGGGDGAGTQLAAAFGKRGTRKAETLEHLWTNSRREPGPAPCGASNWQMRGRSTPGSMSSPGWRELDGSGLGSAGRTDGQGFSTASRAATRQTCLPSLCQPRLRFPLGPSQRQRTCSP